jgi:hypothetical protein
MGVVVGFVVGLFVVVVAVQVSGFVVSTRILMCDLELHITLTPMLHEKPE